MIFEDIVNNIENADKISDNDWITVIDNFIKKEFENKKMREIKYLFYIFVMINMKKVKYSEYTQNVRNSIIQYYKKNKPLLGLQIIQWYQSKECIKKCIDYSLEELGYTIKDAYLFLIEWLVNSKNLSRTKKELIKYFLIILSNKSTFDFNIYKKMAKAKYSIEYSDVCKYISEQMKKYNINELYIIYIDNLIDIYEQKQKNFKELDETVSFYIRENLLEVQLMSNLEKEFDKIIKNKKSVDTNLVFLDYVEKFKKICNDNEIDFYNTKVCKELIYSYIFRYNNEINKENIKIIEQYLLKNQNKVLTDRTSFNIINAFISKKIKIKCKIIKKINNISEIENEEKINNLIRLNNEEKKKFILELNKIKLISGVIPYNICKYVIYCILKYNEFKDIRECILCDFATNIEWKNGIYNVMNYIDETDEMNFLNGYYSHLKYIKLKVNLISDFSNKNVKIIDTIYHEIEHVLQYKDIKEKNFVGNRYYMYIESEIAKKIKNYDKLNYYNEYTEIEARLVGATKLSNFLDEININKDECFILGKTVNEYVNKRQIECKNLLKKANLKKVNANEVKNIVDIWKEINKIDNT